VGERCVGWNILRSVMGNVVSCREEARLGKVKMPDTLQT
jgi:hypothetical protein